MPTPTWDETVALARVIARRIEAQPLTAAGRDEVVRLTNEAIDAFDRFRHADEPPTIRGTAWTAGYRINNDACNAWFRRYRILVTAAVLEQRRVDHVALCQRVIGGGFACAR